MIDPQSRSLEWIEQASGIIPNIADTALVEKAIRALSLLESLVRSGCPFVFKGRHSLDAASGNFQTVFYRRGHCLSSGNGYQGVPGAIR